MGNGRLDQSYPLSLQAIVTSWPLPDGTLLGPRIFSNLSDAPYIGEAAILFNFTRRPVVENIISHRGNIPLAVYFGLLFFAGPGMSMIGLAIIRARRWHKQVQNRRFPVPSLQLSIWLGLVFAGFSLVWLSELTIGILLMLSAQLLPKGKAPAAN